MFRMTLFQGNFRQSAQADEPSNFNRIHRLSSKVITVAFVLSIVIATKPPALQAQQKTEAPPAQTEKATQARPLHFRESTHRFFDRTNLMLFAGVAAVRALDFTSTEHFRSLGDNEVLLSNSIVDNKPLFAGIEVAGTALSIGVAYWLHRTGHHKLERWVSIVHIGAGAIGDIHNYSLGPPQAAP